MSNPNVDVLGPPPSYDSVVYGSDGGSGPVHTGTNIPPPHYPTSPPNYPMAPSDYPTAPYTYPVPPSYPVNPGYGDQQYPTQYNSGQPPRTTIVCANQQPQTTTTTGCRRVIIIVVFVVSFFVIVIIAWKLFR